MKPVVGCIEKVIDHFEWGMLIFVKCPQCEQEVCIGGSRDDEWCECGLHWQVEATGEVMDVAD